MENTKPRTRRGAAGTKASSKATHEGGGVKLTKPAESSIKPVGRDKIDTIFGPVQADATKDNPQPGGQRRKKKRPELGHSSATRKKFPSLEAKEEKQQCTLKPYYHIHPSMKSLKRNGVQAAKRATLS